MASPRLAPSPPCPFNFGIGGRTDLSPSHSIEIVVIAVVAHLNVGCGVQLDMPITKQKVHVLERGPDGMPHAGSFEQGWIRAGVTRGPVGQDGIHGGFRVGQADRPGIGAGNGGRIKLAGAALPRDPPSVRADGQRWRILARGRRNQIGKGRFAQRLAGNMAGNRCPAYIKEAIEYVIGQIG